MKKSIKIFACLLVIFITAGCGPIKRHQRLVEKYPFVHTQDTIILVDTITEFIPKIQHDTIFNLTELHDTVYIEKERLKIKMYTVHDSIYVEGECDSIYIEKVVERKVPIRYYEAKKDFWWIWYLLICGGFCILVMLYKRRNHEKTTKD
jgi:hypothetical protein